MTGPSLAITSVPNLRDIGGYRTRGGGRVRHATLYRSSALNRIHGDDLVAFGRLGISTVYDLRTEAERASAPDRLPPGTGYVVADVIGATEHGSHAELMSVISNPDTARALLGDGRNVGIWTAHYREFVALDAARAAYGRLFAGISTAAGRPALVHCSTGKDRTGWAVAALLMLLDVPDDLVMQDFLASAAYIRSLVQELFDRFGSRGGDPELLRPIFDVLPGYLEASRGEVRRLFGSIEGYFAAGLGIDAESQAALVRAFVEPA
jgi:protein-tyrosine phosphatase